MGAAGIGMLFTGVSSGLQVYSQLQAGKTAERVAKVNDQNAQVQAVNLEAEARNKQLEFVESAKRQRMNQRRTVASLRAQLANGGTRTDTGTPLNILGETAGNFQLAISDAARASTMQTNSIFAAADSVRQQGKMGIWEGQQAKKAATLSAIGTGITAVTQAVSAYGHNKYTGAIKS